MTDELTNIEKQANEQQKIISESKTFYEYYKDNIEWLTSQQEKLEKMSVFIEKQIDEMSKFPPNGRTATIIGTYQENLISLYSQQQAINTSLFNIKKSAIDYTLKTKPKVDDENQNAIIDINKELRRLAKIDKDDKIKARVVLLNNTKNINDELDAEIAARLEAEE